MLKSIALAALSLPPLGRLLATVQRSRSAVFMLHRFAVPEAGMRGHDPQALRDVLEFLRRSGVELVSVDDLLASMDATSPRAAHRARVAFTVDDGYFDFADSGVGAFAAYDCPATLFVVPGIMEAGSWFWWDQVEWAFVRSPRTRLHVQLPYMEYAATWSSPGERAAAMHTFTEQLKRIPDAHRREIVAGLAEYLDTEVPRSAPPTHRVLQWSELRALESRGVRIGPHTMTHPVLARCADDVVAYEIQESARRVGEEVANPSKVFCYPNGRHGDFGQREFALLGATRMRYAITAEPGLPVLQASRRWEVPRFSYEATPGMTARLLFL